MTFIEKYSPYLVVAAGVLLVLFTFINSQSDQKQKDRIEQLTKNDSIITKNVKEIVDTIKNTSTENHKLAIQTKNLTEQVKRLNDQINDLVKEIDKRTAFDAAENLQSGKLKFGFNPRLSKEARIYLGKGAISIPSDGLNLQNEDKDGGSIFIKLRYGKDELLISMKVLDTSGNVIVEIDDNYWRPNPNFTSKRNYDDFGFEVMDNQGNIAMNIDQIGNDVTVQGILALSNGSVMVASDDGTTIYLKEDFQKQTKKFKIRQLFEYTGKNYLGKRR
ncbi:hypothetical protein ACFP1I_22245 [Dyadobacter subterraneus]|uniref:Uncharacterized protein n=1 Tax=Dyadobacter subterraneus TaxID=2773304 RepID=A0ABR9WJF2_9BACT|nr:hypothetical protein [Dyadobacter subterraneus]MBE9465513.1 hypothetical protein [Dyadobacter subterraneus]